ncbi:hypothetical protein BN59_02057 [Legionella massiliensis]|uniref:Uncharacterized protein n=1 Tax=Legionella massiliensis TaxID=1034943 RepID=A0A078KXK3_9GAMM|nr:hypothetical protein [Legionella massiliensis]CDZ77767.1 hypothetical protein BN59_02057 [Legionella massiliensis]CEE13505.1 hypothetical protein BN1094_02057 [Legionella massiliensis]
MSQDKQCYLVLTSNNELYDEDGDVSIDKMEQAASNRTYEVKEYQADENEQTVIAGYRNSKLSNFFPHAALVNLKKQSSAPESSKYTVSSYRFFNADQDPATAAKIPEPSKTNGLGQTYNP